MRLCQNEGIRSLFYSFIFYPWVGWYFMPNFLEIAMGGPMFFTSLVFGLLGPPGPRLNFFFPKHLSTALALPFSNILIHNIAKKLPSDPSGVIDVKKIFFHHFSQIYKRGHISGPSGLSEKKFGGFYFHMGSKKMA